MTNDIEAAARAYLAAYDVESSNSEMWYRAVVDARDALRAALAEATEPATKPEGCPCVCCANRAGMLRAGRTDLRGACYCGMVEDEERCDCAFCLSPTKLVSCSETATPPAPAEGRGEEAERAYAKTFGEILARDICESEPSGVVIEAQDRLQGTDAATFLVIEPKVLAEFVARNVDNAFHDGEIVLRSLPHGDGGGKEAS